MAQSLSKRRFSLVSGSIQAPIRRPTALSEIDKQRIISERQHLESQKFAQTSVSAIKWELSKIKYSFPSDSTINRVLKREGFINKTAYVPKAAEYPYFTEALRINYIHEGDLVGPR
jgi:hypothetical protein